MAQVEDARLRRLARLYLDPLSTWCLAAVVVHALAVVAAGDIVALKLVLPSGIGVAAALLRWADEPSAIPDDVETVEAAPAPAAAPVRPATGSLWSKRA